MMRAVLPILALASQVSAGLHRLPRAETECCACPTSGEAPTVTVVQSAPPTTVYVTHQKQTQTITREITVIPEPVSSAPSTAEESESQGPKTVILSPKPAPQKTVTVGNQDYMPSPVTVTSVPEDTTAPAVNSPQVVTVTAAPSQQPQAQNPANSNSNANSNGNIDNSNTNDITIVNNNNNNNNNGGSNSNQNNNAAPEPQSQAPPAGSESQPATVYVTPSGSGSHASYSTKKPSTTPCPSVPLTTSVHTVHNTVYVTAPNGSQNSTMGSASATGNMMMMMPRVPRAPRQPLRPDW